MPVKDMAILRHLSDCRRKHMVFGGFDAKTAGGKTAALGVRCVCEPTDQDQLSLRDT